jgi:alpha-tubulin suppressor-like RCC1 family protein
VLRRGANEHGQLGLGDSAPRHTPIALLDTGLAHAVAVAAGWHHSAAITADGALLVCVALVRRGFSARA